MKKTITIGATALMLTGAFGGVAAAQTEDPALEQPADDDNDELGLWGLAGLAGLLGLIKRKSHDRSDSTGSSAGARR